MTKEQWRKLKPNDLVVLSHYNDEHIYKVVSTGWDDMDENEYEDDNDYIIEVTDLFKKYKYLGNFIVRLKHTELFDKNLPDEIIRIADKCDSPYDFLKGYFFQNDKKDVENESLLEWSKKHAPAYYEVYNKVCEEIAEHSLKITMEMLYNLGLENMKKDKEE